MVLHFPTGANDRRVPPSSRPSPTSMRGTRRIQRIDSGIHLLLHPLHRSITDTGGCRFVSRHKAPAFQSGICQSGSGTSTSSTSSSNPIDTWMRPHRQRHLANAIAATEFSFFLPHVRLMGAVLLLAPFNYAYLVRHMTNEVRHVRTWKTTALKSRPKWETAG